MELYVLRHAIALDAMEAGVRSDAERPLSNEGRDKMKRIADAMKRLGIGVDLVLSSPYVRARDTAIIAHDGLGLEGCLEFTPTLASGADSTALLTEIKERFKTNQRIMVVGHEPDLSTLISRIISGGRSHISMKKAGLARIEITDLRPELRGVLDFLVPPKVMLQVK